MANLSSNNFQIKKKIWIEYNNKPLIGKGRYELLNQIQKTSSLSQSAKKVGIATKTAYNYIQRIEKRLDQKITITTKGGNKAGAKIELTDLGKQLLEIYAKANK